MVCGVVWCHFGRFRRDAVAQLAVLLLNFEPPRKVKKGIAFCVEAADDTRLCLLWISILSWVANCQRGKQQ